MSDIPIDALLPAPIPATLASLAQWIGAGGGGFVHAAQMRALLCARNVTALSDWSAFEKSWDGMPRDTYMGDGGSYRTRRYATLSRPVGQALRLEMAQAHYQGREYNALNGGVARYFEPIARDIVLGSTMSAVLDFGCALFDLLLAGADWHIEVHQFRIEARVGQLGHPTPEGVHRDGVDHVLVMLVRRVNVASGTTTVHDAARRQLGSFTLAEACDAALLDDRRCYHGVTPVEQIDPHLPAYRDVLVVTWRKK